MHKFLLFLFISKTLLISCSAEIPKSATIDDSRLIKINPLNYHQNEVATTNFVNNIEYIVPQINKLIKIDDLIINHKYIYLVDNSANLEIYCINHKGEHIYTISSFGGAENEYHSISKVILNDETIEIFDFASKKKLVFDNSSGYWINSNSIEYNFEISDLHKLDNKYLVYHSNNCTNQSSCYNYHLIDENYSVLEKILYVPKNLQNYSLNISSNLYKHDKSIYFKELFNDTIYKVDDKGNFESFLFVDFQKRALPNSIKYNNKNTDISPYISNYTFSGDYIFGLRNMVISDSIIFFEYFDKNMINEVFFNFKTNNLIS